MVATHLNLGDHKQIEEALDAAFVKAMESKGYKYDFTLANLKLFLGILACSSIAAAYYINHFIHRYQVGFFCLVYFAVSWLLTFNDWWFEKDTIGIFYGKEKVYRISTTIKVMILKFNNRNMIVFINYLFSQ